MTVPIGTTAGAALDLMVERRFDQLPVLNTRGTVIGTFTNRSFARQVVHLRTQDDPRAALVDDLVEDLHFARPTDNLEDVFRWLESDNAVLVGDEDRVLAVVTMADVTSFLWDRTHPFVLLQDIELATRHLMRSACSANELAECLRAVLSIEGTTPASGGLEHLTLGELHAVLLHKASFGRYFGATFGRSRDLVQSTLEPVRDIRNKVVHFRGPISADEIGTLVRAATWLRRRMLIREEA
ncbi:CBS domain-containing protein [Kribbella solani]|uniref:CBS domain-containing protein n=1 Tax=Kribbella solani TaxID=236067 RepID=UPI0029BF7FEC|nr:CBS domain-containing protein [Kribbella solani]MDX2971356.1 CBS domain-containing protein [Kribbella solani]